MPYHYTQAVLDARDAARAALPPSCFVPKTKAAAVEAYKRACDCLVEQLAEALYELHAARADNDDLRDKLDDAKDALESAEEDLKDAREQLVECKKPASP